MHSMRRASASSPDWQAPSRPPRESFPHKVEFLARTIAELGGVCKASIDYIAQGWLLRYSRQERHRMA